MRITCVSVILAVAAASGANAQSVQAVGAAKASPSIIYRGTPAPADTKSSSIQVMAPGTQISASIVALGEPGVENMKVAAVPAKKNHEPAPVVLRGGVWGGSSAETSSPVTLPTAEPKQPDAAPADVHQEASAPPSQKPQDPAATPAPAPKAPKATPAPGVGSVK